MRVFSKVTVAVAGFMLLAVAVWAAARFGLARSLFSTNFLAHQYCYLRQPALVWTNATSDGVIWLSYVGIAVSLIVLLFKTSNLLLFRWAFVAFGLFIIACGFTHFFEMWTLWNPVYWLSTSVKVLTAAASLATAIALVPLVPRAAAAIRLYHDAYSKSEQQRVETLSKLLTAEERIALAVETAGIGSWNYNPATSELEGDERCRAIFGMRKDEELQYGDFISRVHPEDRAKVQALVGPALSERREYAATFRIVTESGEIRSVIARGRPFFDAQGQLIRFIGTMMDVIREREAEEALVKAEKLAAAGRMAASIAHEINNPLDAALGNVYLARTAPDISETVRKRLEAVEQELERAGKITQSTLTFYRESPNPVPIDPVELVESVLTFQHGSIRKAGIDVAKRLVYTQPLNAFPGELRQILTNLISNAVEAMQGRTGTLFIRVHPARDWCTGQNGYRIVIADTGPGIPEERRKKIFEPFYTTKGEKGTGLGLWITDQLVRKHGGRITFRSRQSAAKTGTVFAIWLPLRTQLENQPGLESIRPNVA